MKYVVLFLLASAICAGQDPASSFTIAGKVTDSVSGRPMARVRVILAPSERPASELFSVITAEDGSFRFEVRKGSYNLRAARNGLPVQTYGVESLFAGIGIAIIAGPGQNTADIAFVVHPPSAISGTVLDETGDPVEEALVQLMNVRVVGGHKRVYTIGWNRTNDLGEYRFSGLASGEYYLAVTGKPWYAVNSYGRFQVPGGDGEMMKDALVPAFYPGTSDPRAATPVALKPGQEAVASFSLFTKPGFALKATCESCSNKRMRLDLISEGILGTQSFHRSEIMFGPLTLRAVPPGVYTVRLMNQDTAKPIIATATVDLTGADAEVALVPQEPARVSGQVTLQNAEPGLLRRLFVSLRSDDWRLPSATREVATDGTFQLPVLAAGQYRLWISGVPGIYASQVTSEDGGVQDGVLTVGSSGSLKVNVVASGGMGRVKGYVRRGTVASSGVLVVLAPAALPADSGWYLGFKTDSDGSFDFTKVRPGDYRLFTTTDTEFEYANPAAIRPFLEGALPLTIEMNSVKNQDLELP